MPIVVGGQIVYPGDIVVADSDGIVFIRPDQAEQVLEQSKKIRPGTRPTYANSKKRDPATRIGSMKN